jgi:DHA3 family tetracycline resistance protein-like MFS transporter
VYRVRAAGLNPLQLVLVGTVLEVTAFVFQIPTGIVADVFSRRLAIIAGIVMMGAGFALEGAIASFVPIFQSQVLWGFGITAVSGAQEAWIVDEVGEARAGLAYVNGSQVGRIGGLIGIPLAVVLASISLNLPLLVGGIGMAAVGMALIPLMPERGFARARDAGGEARSSWGEIGATLRTSGRLVRRSPVLLTILGIGLFYGLYSEAVDRLWQPHFLLDVGFPALAGLTPVIWLGAIDAAATILSLGATQIVKRRVDTASHAAVARALLIMTAGMVVSLVVFGLAGSFAVAAVAFLVFALLRRTQNPYYTAWVVQHTDASVRATVISATGLVDAFGQIAGGPILGVIGTLGSIRAALVAAGGILSPALLLFARTLRPAREVVTPSGDAVADPAVPTPTAP